MENKHTLSVPVEQVALDQCLAAFMATIANNFIDVLIRYDNLPKSMNRNVLKQTQEQLQRCVREIRRNTLPHETTYLDKNLKEDKMNDIASMITMMARIGIEDSSHRYQDFTSNVIDILDSVYYAQENRHVMYHNKYKALFKLIAAEIKADVNGHQGQLYFSQKRDELYVRTVPAITPPQIQQ